MLNSLVEALCRELKLQKAYLEPDIIESIYFGGGTPSLLSQNHLETIFETIYTHFNVIEYPEITLEANPDDLSPEKLKIFQQSGINRLSIGIQSFDDNFLTYLNRPHSGREAEICIENARKQDFHNISIDLIYGIPTADHTAWKSDLHQALALAPNHISAYCLTIEPKTVFGNWVSKGKIKNVDEDFAADQYEYMINALVKNGYEQYEVSNFCKDGFYALHNTNYWKSKKYLGIGPAAHSYNLTSRQYNIANNPKYIKAIDQDEIPCTMEMLSGEQRVNEYIMTGLRTKWGCDLEWIKQNYNYDIMNAYKGYIQKLVHQQMALINEARLILTSKGKLFADKIAVDLFL